MSKAMSRRDSPMGKYIESRRLGNQRLKGGKPISLYDLDWNFIRNYASATDCGRDIQAAATNIVKAVKTKGILMKKYRVSYVKKERPDIGKAKRI